MPREGPVFVIGCPRSGTSAFSWALAQHPDFWTAAESDILHHLFGAGRLRAAYEACMARPDGGWLPDNDVGFGELCAALGAGLDAMFASRAGGRRWVDSTPGYTLMVPELAAMFPGARFVHLVRDGRAVVCSMLASGFDVPWARDFDEACRTWAHYVNVGATAEQDVGSGRMLRVHHEYLVAQPEACCDQVLEFLEADHDGKPAAFLRESRVNSSYENTQAGDIRKPKDPSRLSDLPWLDWSHAQRERFLELCGAALESVGPARTCAEA